MRQTGGGYPIHRLHRPLAHEVTDRPHGLTQIGRSDKKKVNTVNGGDCVDLLDCLCGFDLYRHERLAIVPFSELGQRDRAVTAVKAERIQPTATPGCELRPAHEFFGVIGGCDLSGHHPRGSTLEAAGHGGVVRWWDPYKAVEVVCHAGGCRDLDVARRQPGMLDIDPEPIKTAPHSEVADDVGVEHPPHREDHQSLTTLET